MVLLEEVPMSSPPPGPRGVPSEVLHELLRKGLSNAEVNRALVEEGWVATPLSRQAISQFRLRHGYPVQRPGIPGREKLIPWAVKEEDTRHRFYRCLALVASERAGKELAMRDQRRVDTFVQELHAAQAVVHYSRAEGFHAVPARAGVDRDLIREPGLDDNGRPIDWDPRA